MIEESFLERTRRTQAHYQEHMPYHARVMDEDLEKLVQIYQQHGAVLGLSDDVYELQNKALQWLGSFSTKGAAWKDKKPIRNILSRS